MNPCAMIVTAPLLNREQFLKICQDMLGYSPARAADSASLTGAKYLLSVFSSFKSGDKSSVTVKGARDIYGLCNFACLIAADEYEMLTIFEIVSGMKIAITETTARGVYAALINGTLEEWRDAIKRGCEKTQETLVRVCFNQLYIQFAQLGLESIFNSSKKQMFDQTFYLERA